MMRIVALNEDSNSVSSEDLEPQVTREAEETIAVSEYMRALGLKQKGSVDVALKLLLELLETQVLCEVSPENKNDKLFSVKYNCFRNIGFIYEEKGEKQKALKYLVEAFELDGTDVYTMVRLGKLALSLNNLDIASIAFQKCLDVNPNHWSAADGLLEVYCRNASFLNAYGWALQWHKRDDKYQKAIDVLVEIHERFSGCIPFFEDVWMGSFDYEKYAGKRSNSGSVFPGPVEPQEEEIAREKPDLTHYKVAEFTWLSVGDLIINLYELLNQDVDNFLNGYTWSDLKIVEECHMNGVNGETDSTGVQGEEVAKMDVDCVVLSETEEVEEVKNDAMEPPPVPAYSDNSSNPMKSDDSADKPKKRRGSDLKHLEQWGWHKSRARKKPTGGSQPVEQADKTCSGYLKRILAKYYSECFDTSESPFVETKVPVKEAAEGRRERNCDFKTPSTATEDDFQKRTAEEFDKFVGELKRFDLILLLSKWLEYIAKFWTQSIPRPICEQYVKIYKYYLNHYDLMAWNQLENEEFESVYEMTLFYLEQEHERIAVKKLNKEEFAGEYRRLLLHLMFHSGYYMLEDKDQHCLSLIRLFWINYIVSKYENNLEGAIDFVYKIHEIFQEEKRVTLGVDLPNKTVENHIDITVIRDLMSSLQRTIKLNNVANLYKDHKFRELVVILKDSLINCTEIKNSDNTIMKITTQFEVLLESLWSLNDFEECMRWSEKCLKYAVDFFLTIPENSYRLKEWGDSVNFILIYLEALLKQEGDEILSCLDQYEARLVQSLVKIVTNQLDTPFDKNSTQVHSINFKIPWILLHAFVQHEEDRQHVIAKKMKSSSEASDVEEDEESMPNSVLIFFTAHEFLGRKLWCTKDGGQLMSHALDIVVPLIRSPMLEPFRDIVMEYVEQLTYCLYAYPPKRVRSRHIEEHESAQREMTWEKSMQVFEIYRPDNLPEFDSYKVDSITADLEQLFLKIVSLMPKDLNINTASNTIRDFINGDSTSLPEESLVPAFPMRVSSIFYLLADYYFKNRDFVKSVRFYVQDLTLNPCRFDAWAGLALSKATKLETKLNSCIPFHTKEFLIQSEDTLRCFQQCIKLNETHIAVWIEYGSFAYTLHAYCSRNLKQASETLSMEGFAFVEDRKEQCIKIAYDCFHTVEMLKHVDEMKGNAEESHDEKWLYHYMLGKVSEKRKETPNVYLEHYLKASKYLYDSNATYPIRISHSNPQNMSVEALEIFYRITAAVIKYLEQHRTVTREMGKLFNKVLKQLANSAFMFNQAKLDNNSLNALKRQKIAAASAQKTEENPPVEVIPEATNGVDAAANEKTKEAPEEENKDKEIPVSKESALPSHIRRSSQESNATSVTTTTTGTTGTSSSSSSSSESGSSDSDTDSSSSDDEQLKNTPLTDDELEAIYKACLKNFEECLARFPEHFKSVHRLVHHYLTAPEKLRSMEKAKQLLLTTYTTTLGNKIQGLFVDRKTNNFFNGIWRIPSSEIDRPGSFASHLSKCVIVLMDVLKAICDHKILFELALQLHRSPEADKKYIKDTERKELFQQAISFCVQSFRSLLKRHGSDERNDGKLLDLIIDIYTTHRKCIKHMQQKESVFMGVLVDAYKCYIQDKIPKLPDNMNVGDLAVKLCVHEINLRRSQEKQATLMHPPQIQEISTDGAAKETSLATRITQTMVTSSVTTTTPKSTYIPGLSRPRGRPVGSKNSPTTTSTPSSVMNPLLDPQLATFMAMYSNPSLFTSAGFGSTPESGVNSFLAEYYKMALAPSLGMMPGLAGLPNPLMGLGGMKINPMAAKLPTGTTLQPQMSSKTKSSAAPQIPQVDMKSIIASAANMVASSGKTGSSTINLGGGQLTITPTQQCVTKEPGKGESSKSSKPSYAQEVINSVANKIKMPSMASRMSLPSELPKSLSITPAMEPLKRSSSLDGQSGKKLDVFQGTLLPNPASKAKAVKKRSNTTPYSRSSTAVPPISMSQWGQLTSQYKGAISMPSQAEMIRLQTYRDSYLEFLSNPKANFPSTSSAQSSSKKSSTPRSRETTQVISTQSLISSSKISQSKVDIPKTSLPNFSLPPLPTSPALSVSPAKSPLTPPITSSPTKTLQQKLAERQKANASMNEKKEAPKAPRRIHPDDDVIVLD